MNAAFIEATKEDAREIAELLKEVPEDQKSGVLLLVKGFELGMEAERLKKDSA